MEDEIVLKSCDICGKTFTPKRETHYRCSDTCLMIYERQYAWARWDEIREKIKHEELLNFAHIVVKNLKRFLKQGELAHENVRENTNKF